MLLVSLTPHLQDNYCIDILTQFIPITGWELLPFIIARVAVEMELPFPSHSHRIYVGLHMGMPILLIILGTTNTFWFISNYLINNVK